MNEKNYAEVTERERRHLSRLETLVDCIYAVVIVIIVADFPSARDFAGDYSTPWSFLSQHSAELVAPALGLVLVIMYWAQSNIQLGSLVRTDSRHATLVIVQVILLLTYVYSVDFVLDFPGNTTVLTTQSVIFLLMGVVSFTAWNFAIRGRRLVNRDIGAQELLNISRKILPEPLTAFITIWFSFLGSTAWELAWLLILPISYFVNRIKKV
jgi:uncharacterized membrane protein